MSNPNFEQLASVQKANTDVLLNLLRATFNGLERMTALNIATSRDFFNNTVANAQHLMSAKDASEIAQINSELAKPNMNKLVEYSRNVYNLAAEIQKEMTSVVESQYSNFAKTANSAVEKATATAPVGGDVFAAAMKSILNASSQAFENITAATKQMTDMAEANIQAATSATARAASATSAAAKKVAK